MANIVIEVMTKSHPMRVALKQQPDGLWRAKILGPEFVEAWGTSLNDAMAKVLRRHGAMLENVA